MARVKPEPIPDLIYMLVKDERTERKPFISVTAIDVTGVAINVGDPGGMRSIILTREQFREMARAFNSDIVRRYKFGGYKQ